MICIIPARGGSTRIPRKNIKDFYGKPIIAYSIETAKKSGLFTTVIVTTDDMEIARVACDYGAVPIFRCPELAKNEVGTQEVARDVIEKLNYKYVVCVLYATSPLLTIDEIKQGHHILATNKEFHYSYSIDSEGNDAGNYYFGSAYSFLENIPLTESNSIEIQVSNPCDINTMEDWERAEKLYLRR